MIYTFFWLRSFSRAQWFFWGYKYFLCKFYFRALVKGAPFTQKLHLIYLVNDVLHHWWVSLSRHLNPVYQFNLIEIVYCTRSVRKRADDLKNNLENIVIPMFCSGQIRMFTFDKPNWQTSLWICLFFRGQRRPKGQTDKTVVAVGVQSQLLWCLCDIKAAFTHLINARVQDQFDEHVFDCGCHNNAINESHFWQVTVIKFQHLQHNLTLFYVFIATNNSIKLLSNTRASR